MNPIVFAMRRPVTTLMLVVALIGAGNCCHFSQSRNPLLKSQPARADQ